MMQSLRKRAPTWFARRAGSQECLLDRPSEAVSAVQHKVVRSEFEYTSLEIRRQLEEGRFQSVAETLRKLSHEFIRRCLKSFPFKVLNRHVPKSIPVWEVLLVKLHNNEEGCIPDFPHSACDELVLQIGQVLEDAGDTTKDNADLIHACKRILKKVYLQYNKVLQSLIKENKRIEHALYSLSLHLPIGTDSSAVSLHTAIREEIEACVCDYQETLERVAEIEEKESQLLSQMLTEVHQNGAVPNRGLPVVEIHSPNPSQLQLQERLYSNQWVKRALEPNQRKGNLTQLIEMLKTRIDSDKEVIALFGGIRSRNKLLSDTEAVEPWLRKHQRGVGRCIAILKDIEKELQPQCQPSPTEAGSELSSSLEDTGPDLLTVPVLPLLPFKTEEHFLNRHLSTRRASAAIPALFNIGEKEVEEDMDKMARRNSVPPPTSQQRPRSTSPMKFLRGPLTAFHPSTNGVTQNGAAAVGGGITENGSWKSYLNRSSCRSLNWRESSSSIHDLNQADEPTQAFRRAQSLKAKGRYAVSPVTPSQPPQLPAGRKKTETHRRSSSNLATTSTAGDSKSSKIRNLFRSGSGGLVTKCDTQQQREDAGGKASDSEMTLKLESMNKELLKKEGRIHDLESNVRELTDRLSEQAQRQLQDSEKFEDIQCASRATVVIRRYEELYSQARIEALDAIEAIQFHGLQDSTADMDASDTFNIQLLLDILKTAYHCAWVFLQQLHGSWRELFGVPAATREMTSDKGRQVSLRKKRPAGRGEEGEVERGTEEGGGQVSKQTAEKQLESGVMVYLRRVSSQQDITPIIKMLVSKLDGKYGDHAMYAEVKGLSAVADYMEECVRVAWGLCIQTPHMTIDCSDTVYDPERHKRFYSADKRQTDIVMCIWPVLTQFNGPVLVQGIVLT